MWRCLLLWQQKHSVGCIQPESTLTTQVYFKANNTVTNTCLQKHLQAAKMAALSTICGNGGTASTQPRKSTEGQAILNIRPQALGSMTGSLACADCKNTSNDDVTCTANEGRVRAQRTALQACLMEPACEHKSEEGESSSSCF